MRKDKYCHNCHKLNRPIKACDKHEIKLAEDESGYLRCVACVAEKPNPVQLEDVFVVPE